jgi:hypothetical protein
MFLVVHYKLLTLLGGHGPFAEKQAERVRRLSSTDRRALGMRSDNSVPR